MQSLKLGFRFGSDKVSEHLQVCSAICLFCSDIIKYAQIWQDMYYMYILGIFIIAHVCDLTMKKYQKKVIIIIHSSIDPNHQVKLFQFRLRH